MKFNKTLISVEHKMNIIRRNKKVVYHKHGLFALLRYF